MASKRSVPSLLAVLVIVAVVALLAPLASAFDAQKKSEEEARRLLAEAMDIRQQGNYPEAEKRVKQALDIYRNLPGNNDEAIARCLGNLGIVLKEAGKYVEAEGVFRQTLSLFEKLPGDQRHRTALTLENLALALRGQGKLADAERREREALRSFQELYGERHHHTAAALGNLGTILHNQGKFAEAEQTHRRVLDQFEKLPGDHRFNISVALHSLSSPLAAQRKHEEAEKLLRQALDIRLKLYGERHPSTAVIRGDLGQTLSQRKEYAAAEEQLREAYDVFLAASGKFHHDTALTLDFLAGALARQGKYAEAERLYRQAWDTLAQSQGEHHLQTCWRLSNLGEVLHLRGDYKEAARALGRAGLNFEAARLSVGASGADRPLYFGGRSPGSLEAAALARLGSARASWYAAEARLGRGMLDEMTAAPPSAEQRQRLQQRNERLAELQREILPLITREGLNQDRRKRLEELIRQRGALLDEAGKEAAERQRQLVYPLDRIQKSLPRDTAVLLWFDAQGEPKAADPDGDHWACVVRGKGDPVWVQLRGSGPKRRWTGDDDALPGRVREALSRPGDEHWREAARQLAAQRLAPLEPHLKATADLPAVERLVVIPAGWMAGVPVQALTDRYRVSYAPSGTLHARLAEGHRPLRAASLLALGDPVFDAPRATPPPDPPDHGLYLSVVFPGSNAAKAGLRAGDVLLRYDRVKLTRTEDLKPREDGVPVPVEVWRDGQTLRRRAEPGELGIVLAKESVAEAVQKRRKAAEWTALRGTGDRELPGTRIEVEALAALFGERTILLRSDASEQKLDELHGKGELTRYRMLHLATHGRIDPTSPSRSALILAQDRLPDPAEQLRKGAKVYEGRLTVERIAGWALDADLVVLSACETGLGREGGGEGLLGFTQVLFTRGARSVVVSQWKVHDIATALLMRRFYQNLLGKRDGLKGGMARADALHEAQKWLRELTRAEAEQLATDVSKGVWRGQVQKLKPQAPEAPPKPTDTPFAHPFYWAAFILVGDPD